MNRANDLGNEKISRLVFRIAIPSMLAQFVSVLYSIVDRMFVGNIPGIGSVSLAGVGVCGPIVTMISAFAFLVGVGGSPLMGIALGSGNRRKAERIVANSFALIVGVSLVVTFTALARRYNLDITNNKLCGNKVNYAFFNASDRQIARTHSTEWVTGCDDSSRMFTGMR